MEFGVSRDLKRSAGYFSGASYRVEIEKPGYEKHSMYLTSSLNGGWYIAGNFFIGGLIGWLIVDPLTGAMWSLAPDHVNASLETSAGTVAAGGDAITVVLKEEIDPAELERLALVRVN